MGMVASTLVLSLFAGAFFILVPVALLVVLQVWLCRKSSALGLILPGVSFLLSLLLVFSVSAFSHAGTNAMTTSSVNGEIVERRVFENGLVTVYDGKGNVIDRYADDRETETQKITPETVGAVAGVFLVGNIPTVVFGGIWLHYKNRRDFRNEMNKMRIEDLG